MKLRQTLYMLSGRFSGIFFILTITACVALLIYTQHLVKDLRRDAREVAEFYAQTVQKIAYEDIFSEELTWFFDNVTRRTNFPLIIVSPEGEPESWRSISVPDDDKSPAAISRVKRIIKSIKRENEPIPLQWKNPKTGEVTHMGYLYYGDSKLITQLIYLPYIEIASVGLLVLIAVLGFGSIRRSEQRFIWVGMAKETAHQLGTPISSLMGWLEVLQSEF